MQNFDHGTTLMKQLQEMKKATSTRHHTPSFGVCEERNADGKASGLHAWTSMMGDEKKTVLRYLPDKLPKIIDAEHGDTVAQIGKVLFSLLLKVIDFYHWLYK